MPEDAPMKMAYCEQWEAEIVELRRVLTGFPLQEECKWGKPCFTLDGRNLVLIQGFKNYCSLLFFQGALLKDDKQLLTQLGQTQAARVMKFTSAKEIAAKAAAIKAYVREAITAERAGLKVELKKSSDVALPDELLHKFNQDPKLKKAFEALTPGRQRGYAYHFVAAKQPATRMARIEKAMPAIFAGRGFLERAKSR
jgi:uncharacterized protein YdeI (YjbR/CyaY-like superfamily)